MTVGHINDNSFEKEVLKNHLPVVVDFYADWCGPCKMMAPHFEDISKDFDGKVKFVKINIDENQFYAGEYAVMSIPTLIFFKKGEETDRNVGALNKDSLKAWITKNI